MISSKKIVEWMGGMAVVASLLLVAFEIRQNTNALSAQAVFELNARMSDVSQSIASNTEFATLFRKGDLNPDTLTEQEWYQYFYAVVADLNNYESAYAFYESGIIDDETYQGYLRAYCVDIQTPGYQRVIADYANVYFEGFRMTADSSCESFDDTVTVPD